MKTDKQKLVEIIKEKCDGCECWSNSFYKDLADTILNSLEVAVDKDKLIQVTAEYYGGTKNFLDIVAINKYCKAIANSNAFKVRVEE